MKAIALKKSTICHRRVVLVIFEVSNPAWLGTLKSKPVPNKPVVSAPSSRESLRFFLVSVSVFTTSATYRQKSNFVRKLRNVRVRYASLFKTTGRGTYWQCTN